MRKVINGTKISFFDSSNNEIMYIDYPTDECVWGFNTGEVVTIAEDMDLFELLKSLMSQQYEFYYSDDDVLRSYKNDNKLVWYSDCYYNPDNEWSVKCVSYLTVEYVDGVFKLKCSKASDEIMHRDNKFYVICFSPGGNGRYVRNVKNGLTLQDDFVLLVYQKLLKNDNVKRLHSK